MCFLRKLHDYLKIYKIIGEIGKLKNIFNRYKINDDS